MKNCPIYIFICSHLKKILVISLILVLGTVLRTYRYSYFPVAGETADENAWAMLGASLLKNREPMAWSYFAPYEKHSAIIDQEKHLVKPSLDHPPLFALIPGSFHVISKKPISMPSIKIIRLPMILLGVVNIGLVYIVAKKIFDSDLAVFLATLVYALGPIFVFSNRMVLAENWLSTLFLLSLIKIYQSAKQKKDFVILGIISIVAVLSKFSGLVLPTSLIMLGLWQKKKSYWQIGLISILIGLSCFALYGAFFDWALFVDVFKAQSGRQLGLATVVNRLFLHPTLVDKFFIDGWFFLGLLSTFTIIFNHAEQKLNWKPLISLFLVNLAFILTSVGEQTFHGWYGYLNYPFYALAIAHLLARVIKQKRAIIFTLIWILLLPGVRLALRSFGLYHNLDQFFLRLVAVAGFIPLGLQFINKNKLQQYSVLLLLAVIFMSNILIVFNISHQVYWEGHRFFQF